MSRAENVYDNAFIKSRFGTIKTELELIEYDNSLHARTEIGEHFRHYNLERRHSALGYLSPAAFEALNRHPI